VLKTLGSWWKEFKAQLNKQSQKVERPIKQVKIQVFSELNALKDVLEWFEQFNALPVTNELWWQCQTVLAEGFTNAVRHAHDKLPESTPIEIEVTVRSHWFELRIWDYGQPFDLRSKLKSISQEISEEIHQKTYDPLKRTSGMGLLFMDQLTDELDYTRTTDSRNCLIVRKKLPE
jgi:serine/threonine-protein kinase RsbW